ncbi:MAG: PHP domain-containing protein [Clostridia bacterium]|nr:PHP domain-containing protein [Clostridia bacterium]
MFVLERTYDLDELVRHNMHTHSVFSLCAKPEMTLEAMIRRAEEKGLKTLAVTDHSDPGDDIDTYANFLFYKEKLRSIETPVRVLIGAELSAYGVGRYGEPYEVDKALDFASYSHVHYHLDSWEHPEDRSPRGYAAHELAVLDALFATSRADNIAHPFSPAKMHFFSEDEKNAVLASITDNELGDIMLRGERAGASWEIHTPTFLRFTDFSKRFFNIGREVGVHFVVGTDAHRLDALAPEGLAERLRAAAAGKRIV